jgi:hypothetical protein
MSENSESTGTRTHKAGLFDIRFIIALLLGIYGVITLLTGLFTSDAQIDKADGLNVNVVAGIGMLVTSACFTAWARLRPIVVPDHPGDSSSDSGDQPTGH